METGIKPKYEKKYQVLKFLMFLHKTTMQNIPKHDQKLVKKYGKTFGYFDGTVPNLWTTDADLIKSVFVKDFDHFVNRRVQLLI